MHDTYFRLDQGDTVISCLFLRGHSGDVCSEREGGEIGETSGLLPTQWSLVSRMVPPFPRDTSLVSGPSRTLVPRLRLISVFTGVLSRPGVPVPGVYPPLPAPMTLSPCLPTPTLSLPSREPSSTPLVSAPLPSSGVTHPPPTASGLRGRLSHRPPSTLRKGPVSPVVGSTGLQVRSRVRVPHRDRVSSTGALEQVSVSRVCGRRRPVTSVLSSPSPPHPPSVMGVVTVEEKDDPSTEAENRGQPDPRVDYEANAR